MATVKHVARHRLADRTITPLSEIDPRKLAARSAATMTATGLVLTGVVAAAQAAPTPEIKLDQDRAVDQLVSSLGDVRVGTIVALDKQWDSVETLAVVAEAPPEEEPVVEEPVEDVYSAHEAAAPASVPTVDNSSVAAAALSLTGIPYVWGGESLAGADCSGLVKMAFAAVGIDLPHQSEAILGSGTPIPYSEAQPGDVVWYPGHVAVYVGDGQMVEATVPGTLSSLSSVRGGGTFIRIG